MTTDYLYFGLHLRVTDRRLCVVDPDQGERQSNEWTAQEMELVSGFLQVTTRDKRSFTVNSTASCIDKPCDRPLHVTRTGRPRNRCLIHIRQFDAARRGKGVKDPVKEEERREAARKWNREYKRKQRAAGTFKKWVEPKVEHHCDRCQAVMPNARYDCCAQCRRDDDIARAQRKVDARLAREALRREKLEAKAAAKVKPIDYSTQANIKKYLSCKECTKYVLRELAVARFYCSGECETRNQRRYRRDLPSDSMRI